MKPLLLSALVAALFACNTEKELQAEMVNANLVKIDVINRYPDKKQKMLTWRTATNVLYVTFESIDTDVALGSSRQVLIRR